MLVTRGALTTFSIANDVAKYFAIIPAAFATTYPSLDQLNVMGLASPASAILSAIIFNALIIVALVPLAPHGVKTRAESAAALLRRNLAVYGVGGLIAPFIGVKLILEALHTNQLSFVNGGRGVPWAPEVPIWLSLLVILGILGIATVASLVKSARDRRHELVGAGR